VIFCAHRVSGWFTYPRITDQLKTFTFFDAPGILDKHYFERKCGILTTFKSDPDLLIQESSTVGFLLSLDIVFSRQI